MSRRKNKFSDALQKEFPQFKPASDESDVFCEICQKKISIANKGRTDLTQHLASKKHQSNLRAAGSSQKLTQMLVVQKSPIELKILAAEATLAYHAVQHNYSYLSCDCGSKLFKKVFPDSEIAGKFACARTKTEAIINEVLGPHSVKLRLEEMRKLDVLYIGISTDGSNHGSIKMFPVLVQYFHPEKGIQHVLLSFESLENETSIRICELLTENLEKHELLRKCIAFGGDSCNTNFGGVGRRGENNVFYHMKQATQNELVGVGCPAHLLHNAARHGFDRLDVDVEALVLKIYGYFSIYTIRTEELKKFCTFVNSEYKKVLKHSKTRWLSLMPTVERILHLYAALKSYFNSIDSPPKLLENFFKDDINEAYLWFVHSLMSMFHNNIQNIEAADNSLIETICIVENVRKQLSDRYSQQFLPLQVKKILRDSLDSALADKLKKSFIEVYKNCLDYLDKWTRHFDELKVFRWMLLDHAPKWDNVEECLEYLHKKGIIIDESALFDQISNLSSFHEINSKEDKFKQLHVVHKWTTYFQNVVPSACTELLKIAQFFFAIPSHNAVVERLFSFMNNFWSDERNRLLPESVQALIMVKFNYQVDCVQFYEMIQSDSLLLDCVRSGDKYKK